MRFLGQYITAPLELRNVAADHEVKEALITRSRLPWIIVRPPRLTKGPRTGVYRSGERIVAPSIIPTLSRADVADFMLKQLTDDTYLHNTVSVMLNARRRDAAEQGVVADHRAASKRGVQFLAFSSVAIAQRRYAGNANYVITNSPGSETCRSLRNLLHDTSLMNFDKQIR